MIKVLSIKIKLSKEKVNTNIIYIKFKEYRKTKQSYIKSNRCEKISRNIDSIEL